MNDILEAKTRWGRLGLRDNTYSDAVFRHDDHGGAQGLAEAAEEDFAEVRVLAMLRASILDVAVELEYDTLLPGFSVGLIAASCGVIAGDEFIGLGVYVPLKYTAMAMTVGHVHCGSLTRAEAARGRIPRRPVRDPETTASFGPKNGLGSRDPRRPSPWLPWALALAASGAACASGRAYDAPSGRITRNTAYVLPGGTWELSGGVVGLGYPDLGASIGIDYGIANRAEVRANLAHAAVGAASVGVGFQLVDSKFVGWGLDGSLLLARGSSLWALPDEVRDPISDLTLLVAPIRSTWSFPVASWASLHLGARYVHASIFGAIEEESALIDAGLGLRSVSVDPSAHFYVDGWLAFVVAAEFPLVVFGRQNLEATTVVEPGIRGGVRSSEWVSLPISEFIGISAGVEASLAKEVTIELAVTRNIFARTIGIPVLPSLRVAKRF